MFHGLDDERVALQNTQKIDVGPRNGFASLKTAF